MNKEEIAAAAERLRRYRAGTPPHIIWSTLESDWKIADERRRQDTDILVDYALAHLDEHADEPTIREWVEDNLRPSLWRPGEWELGGGQWGITLRKSKAGWDAVQPCSASPGSTHWIRGKLTLAEIKSLLLVLNPEVGDGRKDA